MISKERLVEAFGLTLGGALFVFAIFSFPLAVYAVSVIGDMGVISSFFAVVALYALIPFGELVALCLAVYGLFSLLF